FTIEVCGQLCGYFSARYDLVLQNYVVIAAGAAARPLHVAVAAPAAASTPLVVEDETAAGRRDACSWSLMGRSARSRARYARRTGLAGCAFVPRWLRSPLPAVSVVRCPRNSGRGPQGHR